MSAINAARRRLRDWLVARVAASQPPGAVRVLVVDDDAAIRSLIAVTLSSEGFDVVEAADGRDAMAIIELLKPDVVTVDAALPDISGWEFADRLRDDPATAGIRVLMLAPAAAPGSRFARTAVGGPPRLEKPFDLATLVTMVRHLATTA
jgi:CheY-like chemotaxis protein